MTVYMCWRAETSPPTFPAESYAPHLLQFSSIIGTTTAQLDSGTQFPWKIIVVLCKKTEEQFIF